MNKSDIIKDFKNKNPNARKEKEALKNALIGAEVKAVLDLVKQC